MRRLALAAALFAIPCAACVDALSSADVASLRASQRLDAEIYRSAGADSGIGAMARAAYCSDEAPLRRNDATTIDAAAIDCGSP